VIKRLEKVLKKSDKQKALRNEGFLTSGEQIQKYSLNCHD